MTQFSNLRIAVITPSTGQSPPLGYGGEVFPWDLVYAYCKLGHQVDFFAPSGSAIPPNGVLYSCPWSRTNWPHLIEEQIYVTYHDVIVKADIVHDMSHTKRIAAALKQQDNYDRVVSTPFGASWIPPWEPYNMVTGCNSWQKMSASGGNEFEVMGAPKDPNHKPFSSIVIPWATNCDLYKPDTVMPYAKDDYFFWISRIRPEKGIKEYLDLAEKLPDKKFLFTGSLEFPDHKAAGAEHVIRARSMQNVEFVSLPVSPIHHLLKARLYREARALVVTTVYAECFGLYVIEALASGTPVIARRVGSFSELVEHGVTGFLCDTEDDFVWAINHIEEIDPRKCREEALIRFDRFRCAEEYIMLFKDVINGRKW